MFDENEGIIDFEQGIIDPDLLGTVGELIRSYYTGAGPYFFPSKLADGLLEIIERDGINLLGPCSHLDEREEKYYYFHPSTQGVVNGYSVAKIVKVFRDNLDIPNNIKLSDFINYIPNFTFKYKIKKNPVIQYIDNNNTAILKEIEENGRESVKKRIIEQFDWWANQSYEYNRKHYYSTYGFTPEILSNYSNFKIAIYEEYVNNMLPIGKDERT